MNLFRLDGDMALVTGAASGIGQRIAVGLAEAGADVACFDLPDSPGLDITVARIAALGRRALPVTGTVTDEADLAAAVAAAEAALGPLALAVNSAGIANAEPAETLGRDQWQTLYDVNVTGLFLSCQAEARAMIPHKRGAIVNIASMSGSPIADCARRTTTLPRRP